MERSGGSPGGGPGGAMKGESGPSLKGDGGPSKDFSGGEMRSGRNEGAEGSRKSLDRAESSSGKKSEKNNKNQANDERNANQRNRQAEDNDRGVKRQDRADDADYKDRKNSDRAEDMSRRDKGATGASEGTEGKVRSKGSLTNISPEQKTKVRAAFSGHRVAPARDIGVDVRVGVVVPRSVHFYPLPPTIVTIAPDYSGYEYFMIDDSHVAIVDPDTLEVVDIIVIA